MSKNIIMNIKSAAYVYFTKNFFWLYTGIELCSEKFQNYSFQHFLNWIYKNNYRHMLKVKTKVNNNLLIEILKY